jgi:hypothetical protein
LQFFFFFFEPTRSLKAALVGDRRAHTISRYEYLPYFSQNFSLLLAATNIK